MRFFIKLFLYSLVLIVLYLATTIKQIENINSWDKLNHILAFSVLYIVFSFSYNKINTPFKFVLLLFLGLLIEVIQYFIPTREFSFYDLVANLVGIAFGYILYKLIRPSKYRKNYF